MRFYTIFLVGFLISGSLLAQTKNPFSIARSGSDTVVVEEKTALTEEESTKIEGENPFDVSHIPIRKNQYKEIERLAISNKSVEENISLGYLPLWVIITSMCLLVFVLFSKRDHLSILIRSITNNNFMKMTNYGENGGRNLPYILGYLIFLANIALFAYLYITKQFDYNPSYFYFLLLGGSVVLFLGKHLVNLVFSWIFHLDKELGLYDFTIISFYNLLGLFFLVLNIFIVFGRSSWLKPLVVIGVLIFIIFLLSRYYKGLRIGQGQLNRHFIHFFIYFCAFEFSPWVIVYSVVKGFFEL